MEADIGAMQADLDEALNNRRAAEERADRLGVSGFKISTQISSQKVPIVFYLYFIHAFWNLLMQVLEI